MRVVSLNIDLPDLLVVKRAVDAYLDQCPCREKRAGDPCEACLSLEATRFDIARLERGPRSRFPSPVPVDEPSPTGPRPLLPVGLTAERPRLRVVSRVEAGG